MVSDFTLRYDRLKNRKVMFWPIENYEEGIFEKRLEYTALNEKGYKSKHYIKNDEDLEKLNKSIKLLVEEICQKDNENGEGRLSFQNSIDMYYYSKDLKKG